MAFILDKGESSVLRFVGSTRVNDDVQDPVSDLPHLAHDLLALLGFRNPAHKQAAVVHAGANSKETSVSVEVKRERSVTRCLGAIQKIRAFNW